MSASGIISFLTLVLGQSAQNNPAEVVFVGTQHLITDMPPGYTPAHLRALLAKIGPSAVAVEAPSNVKNPWDYAPLELQWVTKPWAEARKIPAVPIGWNDPLYQVKLQGMVAELRKGAEFDKLEARAQAELAALVSCEDLNGVRELDVWRRYHKELHAAYGKDTPWETWNSRILENLRPILREYRGKRIAVVFGAAHGYYLADALAREKEAKLLSCAAIFPLSPEEIARNTMPKDHLMALRLLNFASIFPGKLRELETHLGALRNAGEFQGDYELFYGKLLLHKGDAAGAAATFSTVAGLGDDVTSAFDGFSRLNEAGTIYSAIALSRQGKAAEARERIQTLLQKENLTAPSRQWAQQLLLEFGAK